MPDSIRTPHQIVSQLTRTARSCNRAVYHLLDSCQTASPPQQCQQLSCCSRAPVYAYVPLRSHVHVGSDFRNYLNHVVADCDHYYHMLGLSEQNSHNWLSQALIPELCFKYALPWGVVATSLLCWFCTTMGIWVQSYQFITLCIFYCHHIFVV